MSHFYGDNFDYSTLSTSITDSEIPTDYSTNFYDSSVQPLETNDDDEDDRPSSNLPLLNILPAPRDKRHCAYITFFLLGICTLLPWNFFITANNYWMYKFRNVQNDTKYNPEKKNLLQTTFTSYLAITNNLPFIIILFINPFFSHIREVIRNGGSLIGTTFAFLIITAFVKINSDNWQNVFFAVTLTMVCIISILCGIFQGGITALASIFPSKYMYAIMAGQAIAGIISSVAEILSLVIHTNPTNSALGYFISAIAILIITTVCYFYVHKTAFFCFFTVKAETKERMPHSRQVTINVRLLIAVFRRVWMECLTAMLIYWVTLSVFPAICVLVVSENFTETGSSLWNQIYFLPFCCFLLFNIADFTGRIICKWIPLSWTWQLLLLSCFRVVYIPLFMMCNTKPTSPLPHAFGDVSYIILIVTMGVTNGFLCTTAMISGPKRVEDNLKEIAGFILVAFLGTGLTIGSLTSFIIIKLFY